MYYVFLYIIILCNLYKKRYKSNNKYYFHNSKIVSFEELYTRDLFFEAIPHHPFHQVPFEGHGFAFPYKIFQTFQIQ